MAYKGFLFGADFQILIKNFFKNTPEAQEKIDECVDILRLRFNRNPNLRNIYEKEANELMDHIKSLYGYMDAP